MCNANNTSDMEIKINDWCSSNVGFKGGDVDIPGRATPVAFIYLGKPKSIRTQFL
jgi:hypothetical protein